MATEASAAASVSSAVWEAGGQRPALAAVEVDDTNAGVMVFITMAELT